MSFEEKGQGKWYNGFELKCVCKQQNKKAEKFDSYFKCFFNDFLNDDKKEASI